MAQVSNSHKFQNLSVKFTLTISYKILLHYKPSNIYNFTLINCCLPSVVVRVVDTGLKVQILNSGTMIRSESESSLTRVLVYLVLAYKKYP